MRAPMRLRSSAFPSSFAAMPCQGSMQRNGAPGLVHKANCGQSGNPNSIPTAPRFPNQTRRDLAESNCKAPDWKSESCRASVRPTSGEGKRRSNSSPVDRFARRIVGASSCSNRQIYFFLHTSACGHRNPGWYPKQYGMACGPRFSTVADICSSAGPTRAASSNLKSNGNELRDSASLESSNATRSIEWVANRKFRSRAKPCGGMG